MNIYLVKRLNSGGYDTYDSFVASAETEADAMTIHPSPRVTHVNNEKWMGTNIKKQSYQYIHNNWMPYPKINEQTVDVFCIGKTNQPRGVILASFNSG